MSTFFIATSACDASAPPSARGCDLSHRGGGCRPPDQQGFGCRCCDGNMRLLLVQLSSQGWRFLQRHPAHVDAVGCALHTASRAAGQLQGSRLSGWDVCIRHATCRDAGFRGSDAGRLQPALAGLRGQQHVPDSGEAPISSSLLLKGIDTPAPETRQHQRNVTAVCHPVAAACGCGHSAACLLQGNLALNPRAGLLFVDFATGNTLQLTVRRRGNAHAGSAAPLGWRNGCQEDVTRPRSAAGTCIWRSSISSSVRSSTTGGAAAAGSGVGVRALGTGVEKACRCVRRGKRRCPPTRSACPAPSALLPSACTPGSR